jgi:ATP-dependent RNA helicase RhlE
VVLEKAIMTQPQTVQPDFTALGVNPKLVQILKGRRIFTPTPIQSQTIPIGLTGKDVMGIAQTGTGKTLAFGLPIIQRIATKGGQALVILPTRELAHQVNEALQQIGSVIGLRTAILIGGENINRQIKQLERKPHIVIGTPGRLIDHLQQKTLNLTKVNMLVLDEADRMLDMGFLPQIKQVLLSVSRERQTMLFSATMPNTIVKIAQATMRSPLRIEVSPAGTAAEHVTHEVFIVPNANKNQLLEKLLAEYHGTVLVFTRTKFTAKKVSRAMSQLNHKVTDIHSNRSLSQRLEALNGFKKGKYRILIATDIAARGIDVKNIEVVVNYDLPQNSDDYVHRIGRTGRAGLTGKAISFATRDQVKDIRQIERLIRSQIPVTPLPDFPRQTTPSEPMTRESRPERSRFQKYQLQREQPIAGSRFNRNNRSARPQFPRPQTEHVRSTDDTQGIPFTTPAEFALRTGIKSTGQVPRERFFNRRGGSHGRSRSARPQRSKRP